jgi:hypothetical protein
MKEILEKVELEIKKRGLDEEDISGALKGVQEITERRIIGGYCSVKIVDREKQLIPIEALQKAAPKFMANPFFRLINVFHSDVTVGRVLPKWTHPLTGEVYESHIDEMGWWIVCEIRDDIELANKVWNEIRKGNIRSFSIAGSSKEKLQRQRNGVTFEQINDLDVCEASVCEIPVNAMSNFDILWDPERVSVFGR